MQTTGALLDIANAIVLLFTVGAKNAVP
jgi:hypothetical protein